MVALMGYGPEDKNAVLELTYNYGITEYNKGNGYTQVNSDLLQKHILQ
jgi:lactoylglutathione lyase